MHNLCSLSFDRTWWTWWTCKQWHFCPPKILQYLIDKTLKDWWTTSQAIQHHPIMVVFWYGFAKWVRVDKTNPMDMRCQGGGWWVSEGIWGLIVLVWLVKLPANLYSIMAEKNIGGYTAEVRGVPLVVFLACRSSLSAHCVKRWSASPQ